MWKEIVLGLLTALAPAFAAGADLEKLLETGSCEQCDLQGVDLSNRVLTGDRIIGSNLKGANLSGAKLTFRLVHNSDFTDANLSGATFTLGHGGLHGSQFIGSNLTHAKLNLDRCYHTQFRNVQMTDALLTVGEVMRFCNFEDSNLYGARIQGWLYSQHFTRTSLFGARLDLRRQPQGHGVPEVTLHDSDLSTAEVRSPTFGNVRFDAQTKLEGALLNQWRCHAGSLGKCLDESGNVRPLQ